MVIISPRADYETFRADYKNHSTKSARPLSIVKFEFQGDNDKITWLVEGSWQ